MTEASEKCPTCGTWTMRFDPPLELEVEESLDEQRDQLLRRIADLWRGDWTADRFDGDDLHTWITTILDGNHDAQQQLAETLTRLEAER